MNSIGKINIQYARCLWGPKRKVLSVDRGNGGNAKMQLFNDSSNLRVIFHIIDEVVVEDMYSVNNVGAKKRMDIHLAYDHINELLEIIEPFVNSLDVEFDESPREAPDPTGMEHPGGLPLGRTEPITWVKATSFTKFGSENLVIKSKQDEKIIIDAENYQSRGPRLHFGMRMSSEVNINENSKKEFQIVIKYDQLQRFTHAIRVAKRWLTPS